MNTVPVYEAKNKFPFYLHQAEEDGPVFISRHNQTVGVLLSYNDYNRIMSRTRKRTILDAAAEFRKKVDGTLTDEEIDRIFDVRDHSIDTYETNVFEGVFGTGALTDD